MKLNFKNIEDTIFYNKEVCNLLPEMSSIFQKWTIGKKNGIQSLVKLALIEFFNNVTEEQIKTIENHLNFTISVEKINREIIKNYSGEIDKLELKGFENFQFCLYRKGNNLYMSGVR